MKKFLAFLLVLISLGSTAALVYVSMQKEELKTQLEELQIPEANTTDQAIGIVYLLGSSNVYDDMDSAFQGKVEKGKLAHGDVLSQVCSMGRLGYIQGRIYGIKYDRVLTQQIPGKPEKKVYQVGELFIVPDTSK